MLLKNKVMETPGAFGQNEIFGHSGRFKLPHEPIHCSSNLHKKAFAT